MSDYITFAVDFDGCLCKFAYPDIGEQSPEQKELLQLLIGIREKGHKVILWTVRGEPALQEAIEWCKGQGLEFDAVNVNPWFEKTSGPSPKVNADYYIDDRGLTFSIENYKSTLDVLRKIANES